jgi:hypothetical protein
MKSLRVTCSEKKRENNLQSMTACRPGKITFIRLNDPRQEINFGSRRTMKGRTESIKAAGRGKASNRSLGVCSASLALAAASVANDAISSATSLPLSVRVCLLKPGLHNWHVSLGHLYERVNSTPAVEIVSYFTNHDEP